MDKKATVGNAAPLMNISDYLQHFPKALVQDQKGQRYKSTVSGITIDDKPIGTGIDGQLLEVPKIVPAIGYLEAPNEIAQPTVPYTTALGLNTSISFSFQLRSNPYGPMMVKGFYVLAFDQNGAIQQLDQNGGGHTIEASIRITGQQIWQGHLALDRDDWYVFALPVEAGAGAQVDLTLTRFNVASALPDPVYLAFGLYGIQRHFIPPSFHIDSSLDPIRNQSTGFRVNTFPAQAAAGPPVVPSITTMNTRFDNRHPTIVDEMWFGGNESTFFNLRWEAGELCPQPIPTALFRYHRQGGQLPSPLLVNAPMTLNFDIYNWQATTITQSLNVASASFGY